SPARPAGRPGASPCRAVVSDERYALDGWDTARPGAVGTENFDVFADLDAAGTVTARRVFGPGFDEPVARLDPSGEVGWYGTDSQDSVRLIFDNTGTVTGSRDYTAFGAITAESGAGLDRYAYTAREGDAALGLQSNRQRMYDPATGRFTSEDPSGLSAGDVNLFRYAGNAVTVFTDPSGLEGWFSENAQGLWNRFNSGLDRVADNAQGLGDRFMNGLDQLANNPEAVADRFMNGLDRVADLWNRFGNQVRHRAAEAYGKAQEACQRLRNDPLGFGEQLAEDFWARAKDFRSRFFSGWDSLGTAEGWQRAGDIYSNGASWWADQIANHPAETAADAILLYLMSRLPAVFGD